MCALKDPICEPARLYKEQDYTPDEDEKALIFMLRADMTAQEKPKALADAWRYATNSGYCDSMANRLMEERTVPKHSVGNGFARTNTRSTGIIIA